LLGLLSLAVIVIVEILWRNRVRWRLPVGSIAMVAVALLCLGRAAFDTFRGAESRAFVDAWTVAGWLIGALALASLALYRRAPRYA
jgi:hypothetical protein